MSRNGERALAEAGHMEGTGWATRIEERLKEGEKRFDRLEKRTEYTVAGLTRLDQRVTEQGKLAGSRHAELLGAIEGVRRSRVPHPSRPSFGDDDAEEITGVESMDDVKRTARKHRAKAAAEELRRKRWEKVGAALVPILIGAGAALVKLIEALAK